MVQLEMLKLDADNKHVILKPVFNSRTGSDLEFFDIDNARNDQFVEIFETMENELPLLNNDLKRNNEDKCLNTYGKLLLEMCKSKKLIPGNCKWANWR